MADGKPEKKTPFTAWWEQRGPEVSNARRTRYRTDEAYKKRVLAHNRRYRQIQKSLQPPGPPANTRIVVPRGWRSQTIMVSGLNGVETKMEVMSVGALAAVLNRSPAWVCEAIAAGTLPAPIFKSPHGDRYYSMEQALELKAKLIAEGKLTDVGRRRDVGVAPYLKTVRFPDGRTERMALYRIGALATAIGRTVVAVTQLEKDNVLPETTLRGGRDTSITPDANDPKTRAKIGYRLYTVSQIEAAAAVSAKYGRLRGDQVRREFRQQVEDAWRAQGILGAVVVEDEDDGQSMDKAG